MKRLLSVTALTLLAGSVEAQQLVRRDAAPAATSRPTTTLATAIRASESPRIDGLDADALWREATAVDGFRQFDPKEDVEPALRTEARFAYDDRNLYVLVRAFDSSPDSIMALLSRRDERTQSDYIRVIVDSYHDKRTGYEFMVNPAGVKRDIYLYNDSNEDVSWDAVWDVKTSIDSLGWLAEFRIPLEPAPLSEEGRAHVRRRRASRGRPDQRAFELAGVASFTGGSRVAVRRSAGNHRHLQPAAPRVRALFGSVERQLAARRRFCSHAARHGWRGHQVRFVVEPDARRGDQPGLRPGRSRSIGPEPRGVRAVLRRAAPVLPRRHRHLPLRPGLQRRGVHGTVLLTSHWSLAAAGLHEP